MYRIALGIDPGVNGAMCWMDENYSILRLEKLPILRDDGRSFLDVVGFRDLLLKNPLDICIVEKQWGMHRDTPKTAFSVGAMFMGLTGTLRLSSINTIVIPAQTWQRELLGKTSGDSKQKAAFYVSSRWPSIDFKKSDRCKDVDSGYVDAACIAEYGVRHMLGGK